MKAKKNLHLTDLYSDDSLGRFNKWMYKWVDSLERSEFDDIIKKALKEYQPYSWNLFSQKSRSGDIYQALKDKNHSNSSILANIFTQGQIRSGSFNNLLFNLLLQIMQTTISISKGPDTNAQLVMQVARNDSYIQYYLQSLANYAKAITKTFQDKITSLHNKQLARLIQTPETSQLYHFFNYTDENRKRALGHLPLEILLCVNEQLGPDNAYYQKAKTLIELEPLPRNENELRAHEVRVIAIVDKCIGKAIELSQAQVDETQKDTSAYMAASCGP